MSEYDVLVIGGGNNGLTCACYLARAGLLVLETADHVGGAVDTGATIAPHSDYRFDTCSVIHNLLQTTTCSTPWTSARPGLRTVSSGSPCAKPRTGSARSVSSAATRCTWTALWIRTGHSPRCRSWRVSAPPVHGPSLSGAGTFRTGGLLGVPGRSAAKAVLTDLARSSA